MIIQSLNGAVCTFKTLCNNNLFPNIYNNMPILERRKHSFCVNILQYATDHRVLVRTFANKTHMAGREKITFVTSLFEE